MYNYYVKLADARLVIMDYIGEQTVSKYASAADCKLARDGAEGAMNALDYMPPADVVPKSEVAELLRLMFDDDCACNYNGNDEWLPEKCKFALTDCPMPKERLGCWMEFVEYALAELKKKYTEGEPNVSK